MTVKLTEFLNRHRLPPDTEERVTKAKKEALSELKDIIQAKCKLSLQRKFYNSEIKVLPGYPREIEKIRDIEFPDEIEIYHLLCYYREHLENSMSGNKGVYELLKENPDALRKIDMSKLINKFEKHRDWIKIGRSTTSFVHFMSKHLLDYISGFRIGQGEHPVSRILSIDEDILGVYRYRIKSEYSDTVINTAKIELYWAVLGVTALWLPCRVEDLTTKVLAHELAHAFTQLGADAEGRIWNAKAFSSADRHVVEGLAQYYTHLSLKSLASKPSRNTAPFEVYEKLYPLQHAVYRAQLPWLESNKEEDVRLAMLQFRRQGETSIEQFEERLDNAQYELEH